MIILSDKERVYIEREINRALDNGRLRQFDISRLKPRLFAHFSYMYYDQFLNHKNENTLSLQLAEIKQIINDKFKAVEVDK